MSFESFVDVTFMARADFTVRDAVVSRCGAGGLASTAKRSGLFIRFSCSLRMICKRTLPKSDKKKGCCRSVDGVDALWDMVMY